MNIGILAARKDQALARIAAAAPQLGKKFGIPAETLERLTAENKDREVEAMERLEAAADLIEFLAIGEHRNLDVINDPEKTARSKVERK